MTRFLPSYDDEGDGPAVVLLHAGVCDRRMWEPQASALTGTHRVVRPDFRGFGATPLPPGQFSFAEDVVRLLDHLEIGTAVLVGSSFGGRVALEVAASAPDRVTSLFLLCPAHAGVAPSPELEAFGEQEDELLEAGDLDAAVELNVRTWLGPEASPQWRARVREMQRHAFAVQLAAEHAVPPPEPSWKEVRLDAIAVPTTVVSGGRDLVHFEHVARHVADRIPRAMHHHLSWAGHLPSLERPDEVDRLLADHLTA